MILPGEKALDLLIVNLSQEIRTAMFTISLHTGDNGKAMEQLWERDVTNNPKQERQKKN